MSTNILNPSRSLLDYIGIALELAIVFIFWAKDFFEGTFRSFSLPNGLISLSEDQNETESRMILQYF